MMVAACAALLALVLLAIPSPAAAIDPLQADQWHLQPRQLEPGAANVDPA
jgi:hypothetical protein